MKTERCVRGICCQMLRACRSPRPQARIMLPASAVALASGATATCVRRRRYIQQRRPCPSPTAHSGIGRRLDALNRAVERGYRAINLSYIDEPAVAQLCFRRALQTDSNCAREFREKRTYGNDDTPLITSSPTIEKAGGSGISTEAHRSGAASPLLVSRRAGGWRSSSASAKWSRA
jgi:hypothetical protein